MLERSNSFVVNTRNSSIFYRSLSLLSRDWKSGCSTIQAQLMIVNMGGRGSVVVVASDIVVFNMKAGWLVAVPRGFLVLWGDDELIEM